MPDPTISDDSTQTPRSAPVAGPTESNELPSLLSLFEQPVASTVVPVPAAPLPAPAPLPSSPSASTASSLAADAAARQQAEHLVARLRQQAAPTPPTNTTAAQQLVAPPQPAPPVVVPPVEAAPRRSHGLFTGLLVVSLAALAILSYLALHRPSTEAPVATKLAVADPVQPSAALPLATAPAPAPVVVRETVRVAVPSPAVPRPAAAADSLVATPQPPADSQEDIPAVAAGPTAADSEPVPAAPETGDNEATRQVRETLAAYYADLYEPPLHAASYFAPQVERLYIQRNLTPEQIDAELARSFFPDNRHAAYQVEPGTLRVSEPAADGSRTATYTEAVRLFRVSRGQHQRLRTQVRVRFNADGQIVYLRQEKLLGNEFE